MVSMSDVIMDVGTSGEHPVPDTDTLELMKEEGQVMKSEGQFLLEQSVGGGDIEEMAAKASPGQDASTTCPECLKPLRIPRVLACLHTLCEDCVRNCMQPVQGTIDCPVCHRLTKVPPAGFAVLPMNWVTSVRQRKQFCESSAPGTSMPLCEDCIMDEEETAVAMCIECRIFLCSIHTRAHKRSKLTQAHSLIEKEEKLTASDTEDEFSNASVMCGVHPHRPVLGFCLDCLHTFCTNCRRLSHSEHNLLEMDEACEHSRRALQQQHRQVREQLIPELTLAQQEIDNTLDKLEERSQELSLQITDWVQKQVNELRRRERHLLTAVSDLREQKEGPLTKQRTSLSDLLNKARHATDLSGAVIGLQNGVEVLDMFVSIDKELASLQSQHDAADPLNLNGVDFMQFVPSSEVEQSITSGIGLARGYPASPAFSEIVGTENSQFAIKKDVCVTVQLRDDKEEAYVQGCDEDSLTISVHCPNGKEVECALRHFRKGLHKVIFKPEVCGTYTVDVCLHGNAIHNSPYQVTVPMHFLVTDRSQALVTLSPDRRTAECVKMGDCTFLGDMVFRTGCHAWTVRVASLPLLSTLVIAVGVIALPCDGVGECTLYSAWSWRSDSTRVAGGPAVVQSCLGKWLGGDEIMLELDCTAGSLTCTQLRSGLSDTMHGVRPPVRPFFFMQDAGHCLVLANP